MLWSLCQQDIIDIWFLTSRSMDLSLILNTCEFCSSSAAVVSDWSVSRRQNPDETCWLGWIELEVSFLLLYTGCAVFLPLVFPSGFCLIKVGLMNHIVKQRQTCGSNQAQHTEGGEPTHGRSQSCCSLFWMSSFSHFHVYMLQMWHLLILPFSSVQFSSAEPH